ncbi:hypothetical protein Pan258_32290 [Symmachiella dynata]|nr:hypothetical protein Pan258_32290 [Symmachiella dynata]
MIRQVVLRRKSFGHRARQGSLCTTASRRFGMLRFHARESVFDLWLKIIAVLVSALLRCVISCVNSRLSGMLGSEMGVGGLPGHWLSGVTGSTGFGSELDCFWHSVQTSSLRAWANIPISRFDGRRLSCLQHLSDRGESMSHARSRVQQTIQVGRLYVFSPCSQPPG